MVSNICVWPQAYFASNNQIIVGMFKRIYVCLLLMVCACRMSVYYTENNVN